MHHLSFASFSCTQYFQIPTPQKLIDTEIAMQFKTTLEGSHLFEKYPYLMNLSLNIFLNETAEQMIQMTHS